MRATAVIALLWVSAAVHAQVVSTAADSVEVTIYRDGNGTDVDEDSLEHVGLEMISEQRTVTLPAGRSVIRFLDVADAIVPQTVKLEGLPTPVVESNFDFDLLSPGSLLAKSIGLPVRLIRTLAKGKEEEYVGTLRSGPQGVVVETAQGIEAVGCGGLSERLVFTSLPATLADKPTLSVTVDVPKAGRYALRLHYLTLGLKWSADYVAKLNDDGKTLDLTAWITLTNRLSFSFRNAPVKVVAGNLSRDREATVPPEMPEHERSGECWPTASYDGAVSAPAAAVYEMVAGKLPLYKSEMLLETVVTASYIAKQTELGDYKLYTLPERTSVLSHQTKQVRMIDKRNVPYERLYRFEYRGAQSRVATNADTREPPQTILRLQNRRADGLGLPLPAGIIDVMEPDARKRLVLSGEQQLDDIPEGLPVEIEIGAATDIIVEPRVLNESNVGAGRVRLEMEVGLVNAKPIPARLELVERVDGREGARIVSESQRHQTKNGNPMWAVILQPNSHATLRYAIEYEK